MIRLNQAEIDKRVSELAKSLAHTSSVVGLLSCDFCGYERVGVVYMKDYSTGVWVCWVCLRNAGREAQVPAERMKRRQP